MAGPLRSPGFRRCIAIPGCHVSPVYRPAFTPGRRLVRFAHRRAWIELLPRGGLSTYLSELRLSRVKRPPRPTGPCHTWRGPEARRRRGVGAVFGGHTWCGWRENAGAVTAERRTGARAHGAYRSATAPGADRAAENRGSVEASHTDRASCRHRFGSPARFPAPRDQGRPLLHGDARRYVPAPPPVGGNAAGAAYCHHYLVTENC